MRTKQLILICVLSMLLVVSPCGFSAKRSRQPLVGRDIVKDETGAYFRGSAKIERDKVTLTDLEGVVHTFDKKKATVLKLSQLSAEFKKMIRKVKRDEDDKTSEYLKLLPEGRRMCLYEDVYELAEKLVKRNPSNPSQQAVGAKAWAEEQLKRLQQGPTSSKDIFQLTDDQIQRLRYLLFPDEGAVKGMRITFNKDVCKRFIDQMVENGTFTEEQRKEFLRLGPVEQLQTIKRNTTGQFQSDILIRRDPPVVTTFRRLMTPILARSCANRTCHSGDSSRLKFVYPMRQPEDVYVNFFIMEHFPARAGQLINRANPNQSLIATYALPPEAVSTGLSHPTPIKPMFKSTEDKDYKELMTWLSSLPVRMPDYGIPLPSWPEPTSKPAGPEGTTTQPSENRGTR